MMLANLQMFAVSEALTHFAGLVMFAAGEASLNTPGHVNFTWRQPYGCVCLA